jgi:alkylation response protein AidB-like acyl-CoA dehydrogenase
VDAAMTDMPREKAREWDKGSICPAEVMKKLGAMGLMGLTVEERFGGAGVDIYATMAVIEEIAKRSVAVACPYIMAVCYAGMNLGESASEDQKQELLPKVAAGDLLFACGLSDQMDMERYVRDAVSLPIVGGSSNMQKNNIANRLKLGA